MALGVTPSAWSLEAGSSVVVTAEVANQGISASAPFEVGVYLSGNNTFPPELPVPSADQERRRGELTSALSAVEVALAALD